MSPFQAVGPGASRVPSGILIMESPDLVPRGAVPRIVAVEYTDAGLRVRPGSGLAGLGVIDPAVLVSGAGAAAATPAAGSPTTTAAGEPSSLWRWAIPIGIALVLLAWLVWGGRAKRTERKARGLARSLGRESELDRLYRSYGP